ASEAAREALVTQQVERGALGPEYVLLDAAGARFAARYVPAAAAVPVGGLLVIPGYGRTLAAEPLVDALLEEFPPNDWAVIAIQAPLLEARAEIAAYAETADALHARIDVAHAHLTAAGVDTVVVVALGDVATAVAAHPATGSRFAGVATRGAWVGETTALELPVVEFIPAFDARALQLASARALDSHRADRPHRLLMLDVVGGNYGPAAASIARRLRGWIGTVVEPWSLAHR
ncbi:MAG: hypothetical protein ACU85V_19920, partial [Gammaproteobacteria bacterium]